MNELGRKADSPFEGQFRLEFLYLAGQRPETSQPGYQRGTSEGPGTRANGYQAPKGRDNPPVAGWTPNRGVRANVSPLQGSRPFYLETRGGARSSLAPGWLV